LVELIARGAKSGKLDAAGSARAFRRLCDSLAAADHSAKSIALAREWSGADFLRLTGARRASFDHLLAALSVPRLDDPAKAAPAIGGIVYAATLAPEALLVHGDPGLLAKHRFVSGKTLFAAASLERSNQPPGSRFSGGFAGFEDVAAKLAQGRVAVAESVALQTTGAA